MTTSWQRFAFMGLSSCLLCAQANAEEPPNKSGDILPEIGVKLSGGGTTFRASSDDRMVGVVARAETGYSVGVYATPWRYRWLRLQTELLYTSRKVTLAETRGVMKATYSLQYLEAPVLARADVPLRSRWRPFAALGIAPGVLVDATHERGLDLSGVLNSLDVGVVGAVGTTLAVSPTWDLTIEARGVYGLTDVFVRTSRTNRAVLLTLGVGYNRVPRQGVSRADHREWAGDPHTDDDGEGGDPPDGEAHEADVPRFHITEHEYPTADDLPIEDLHQIYLLMAAAPCYHQSPDSMRRVSGHPELEDLVTLSYTRTSNNGTVIPSEVEVVHSAWDDPVLERCIVDAIERSSWPDEGRDVPDVTEHVLGFPHYLLSEVVRNIQPGAE